MADFALRNEEKIGLGAAVLLHGALVGLLAMQTMRSEVAVFPERINVSLTTEVGLEAAAPDPVSESRMAAAPTIDINPAPAPEAANPEPAPRAAPVPPKPPARTATQQPAPTRDRSRPDRTPPKQVITPPRQTTGKPGGAPRIGDDFLDGKGSSTTTTETRAPAAKFGSTERAALFSAITRQIRPHWQGQAPSGVDVEKLVAVVNWELNPDGSLKGRPRCKVNPASITTSNQPQVGVYCERAIRAVQRAAPFKLPEQFYDRWKALEWQFDRRL
ncbi:energy transducer TonB [Erythrobacter oryzae]|uniref:energy transducer TonB n=1 Tax=Erythrobacter oryzae TaxID=3019556 RepID=UPI002556E3D2|nr:energy transducer TonB [Erythrobacter sp. COR-2]